VDASEYRQGGPVYPLARVVPAFTWIIYEHRTL